MSGSAYRSAKPHLLKYAAHTENASGSLTSTPDEPPDPPHISLDEDKTALQNHSMARNWSGTSLIGSSPFGSIRRKKEALPTWFYIVMCISISFLSFGSYYSYDSISALEGTLKEVLSLDGTEFSLFFVLYSVPNIVVVIFGGIFIDRVGNKIASVVLCSLVAIGTLIVVAATYLIPVSQKWAFVLMLAGRFIFGVGAESSYGRFCSFSTVVQNSMCVEWFTGSKLATAIGITAAFSRIGSIVVYEVSPPLDALGGFQVCLWLAFATTIFSLGSVLVYLYLCKWAESRTAPQAEGETPSVKSILKFSPLYWISLVICALIYSTISPFRSQSASQISERYNLDEHQSNFVLSLVDITSIVISPLCGWIVDKTYQRGWIVLIGNFIGVGGFLMFSTTQVTPYVGVIVLGIHTTVVPAALYPCIPLLTSPANEGLAYAVMSSLISLALTGMSPLAGTVLENHGLGWLSILLAGVSLVASILTVVWNVVDFRSPTRILNMPDPASAPPSIEVPESPARNSSNAAPATPSYIRVHYRSTSRPPPLASYGSSADPDNNVSLKDLTSAFTEGTKWDVHKPKPTPDDEEVVQIDRDADADNS